jgi:hypothetical protein
MQHVFPQIYRCAEAITARVNVVVKPLLPIPRIILSIRLPVGSKEIGEGVQYSIDDVNHGQRSIPKRLK